MMLYLNKESIDNTNFKMLMVYKYNGVREWKEMRKLSNTTTNLIAII